MDDFLARYWALIFALVGTLAGWVLGLRKNQWEITQFKDELTALKQRVEHLETQGNTGAATLAGIAATLGGIEKSLSRIELDLRGKADKP